jgi:hypothetical protein
MYYIYHIPSVKIGCTRNPKDRIYYRQKYKIYEILETHTDIYIASDREIELQKQYGYPVDKLPYWQSVERLIKSHSQEKRIKGGKTSGNNNVLSGVWKQCCIAGGKVGGKIAAKRLNTTMIECVHCGNINNIGNHNRWHGDNCKKAT